MIRQKGGLSSFHIPEECILNPVWKERYFPNDRSEYHKRLQRNERLSLEKHVTAQGCKLIIAPSYATNNRDKRAAIARLQSLVLFLNKHKHIVVAFQNSESEKQSLTIVGNYFLAESVSFREGDGYTNTFFTRDASEITRRTEDFDCELHELLVQKKWTSENSREKAIEALNEEIQKLLTC